MPGGTAVFAAEPPNGRQLCGHIDSALVACYDQVSPDAGWSSPVARWAHNPKVAGSNPAPATKIIRGALPLGLPYTVTRSRWGARSVPVARSLRSLALTRAFAPRTPRHALSLGASLRENHVITSLGIWFDEICPIHPSKAPRSMPQKRLHSVR